MFSPNIIQRLVSLEKTNVDMMASEGALDSREILGPEIAGLFVYTLPPQFGYGGGTRRWARPGVLLIARQ